jgi:hypothetical protein
MNRGINYAAKLLALAFSNSPDSLICCNKNAVTVPNEGRIKHSLFQKLEAV